MSTKYDDEDFTYKDFKDEDCFVTSGYSSLLSKELQAYQLSDSVILGEQVSLVDYSIPGQVVVTTKHNASYIASYVLVTFSTGVLQSGTVEFRPPPPVDKFSYFKMAVYSKVYMQFPEVFWDDEEEFIGFVSSKDTPDFVPFPIILNLNHQKYFPGSRILHFPGTGEYALAIEKQSQQTTVKQIRQYLENLYNTSIPEPTEVIISSWHNNSFTYGSYSYYGVGDSPKAVENLAEPLRNSVFFAGEAVTKKYAGYVHGAWLSGQHAAELIVSHMESVSTHPTQLEALPLVVAAATCLGVAFLTFLVVVLLPWAWHRRKMLLIEP